MAAMFLTLLALLFMGDVRAVIASIAVAQPSQVNRYTVYELMASTTAETTLATTTTATSTNIAAYADSMGRIIDGTADVRGARAITAYFSHGGLTSENTGTSTHKIQVSRDGSLWQDFNWLLDATSTLSSVRVSSVQIPRTGAPATTTEMYHIDLTAGGYQKVRCITVITGATEAGCAVGVTY